MSAAFSTCTLLKASIDSFVYNFVHIFFQFHRNLKKPNWDSFWSFDLTGLYLKEHSSLYKPKPTIIIYVPFFTLIIKKGIDPLICFSDTSYTNQLEFHLLPYFHGSVYHLLKSKELQNQFEVGMFCQGMYWVIYCVTFSHQNKKASLGRGNSISGLYTEGKKYSVAREVQKMELYDPKDWIGSQISL